MEANITKVQITEDEGKKYNFFVKSTAEFDAFADFEPITNLTAKEAVSKFEELRNKGLNAGIGINIPNDIVFDDPEGNGITILVTDEKKLANFNIFGENFISDLNIKSEKDRSLLKNRIAAYEALYNELVEQSIPAIEPEFVYNKKFSMELSNIENEPVSEQRINSNVSIEIKPVTLEEILGVMEMRTEVTPEGKIKVFDLQRQEYIDNRSDLPAFDEDNWTFNNAGEVFERLDVYINDYYVHDMQEQLEDSGIKITGDETFSDLCSLYKTELENGNDKLSLGELNLAMGIVNPDAVIVPVISKEKSLDDEKIVMEQKQTIEKKISVSDDNAFSVNFTIFRLSNEQFNELKEHLSLNGYKVEWEPVEDSKFTNYDIDHAVFKVDYDSASYVRTILEDRNIYYHSKMGLTSLGFDGKWVDNPLNVEIVSEEEFKHIQEEKEKRFIENKIPYIKIGEHNESSYDNYIEGGTVLSLQEADAILPELNEKWGGGHYKTDFEMFFPEEDISYAPYRYELGDERPLGSLSDNLHMLCSHPEVLETFESNWKKVYAPSVTEEQEKALKEIIKPVQELLETSYKQRFTELEKAMEENKKLNTSFIVEHGKVVKSEEEVKSVQTHIKNIFNSSIEMAAKNTTDYIEKLYDQLEDSQYEDLNRYSFHLIANMIEDVEYGESRMAGADYKKMNSFNWDAWRKSLEELDDNSELIHKAEVISVKYREDLELVRKAESMEQSAEEKVELSAEQWRACDVLAEKAKMDWWFEDYGYDGEIHSPVLKSDLDNLSTAFDGVLRISKDNEVIVRKLFNDNNIKFNEIPLLSSQEANAKAENLYGFYFEYNDDEKCSDIYSSKDGDFVGSYSDGGFGYADGMGIDVPKIPDEVFQDVIALSRQFYIESEKEIENLHSLSEAKNQEVLEIQTGAAKKVQSESLSDLPVEELREGLKYALNEVAQPLPEIDFTRENYNKLFPRDRLKTPIETVKIGAHQFEKLEVKDRKNLLQAVHDVLSTPDVIINEEKESIFGDMENSHVYAKSYVINEKTKAVQSVVVNIEDEYISISTHKRDISNVVNKIKKPDQLLFAAAKVRLLAEQHTKEKLSQSVVSPNRENEYVIPPQTNIPQPQEKSSDEISQNSFTIKGEKYSFSDAEALLKEDIAAIFEELDSSEIEQNLTLNGVKIYGNPEKDGKIKLLVEFDSKNPENRWGEASLFNAIGDENITFNGMEVDVNPITPEKSGTIEEYLSHLERLDAVSEAEVIEKQAELIASREEIKEDNQIDDVLEQCNKILDKYSNTHFTELEQRYINECETKNDARHQVLMSLCNMKYVHVTTKDKEGYWEIKKGKEISANEARKLMSYDDFASGLDRASFHLTAGRNANDGSFVYFNDSERKRDIQPYELTKEDYLLLSQYEKAGGSTEIIPEAILQQLLQYNINANIENPKILSWQEIEDYFSARNVRETKNEVLESFTESQEKPAEKELKEECVARLLENQIDFYGFDTNKTDDKLNSEISVAKWDVLEKIAEKTVSKELDLKPYAVIQEEADKLLMENSVFQECIKNGIISEPDFLLKTENKKDIELTAEDIKNAKALLPKEQYQLVLGYTQGEEGEHFKGIIKEISSKAEAIKGKKEILTEDEKHPLAFKYIMGASSFYFSEWDGGDELYGYVVLNGNTQDSEWGYTSLEELKNSSSKDRNGFPVIPEMIFYGLEDTIEKQISVDYPELTEQIGIKPKLNHNEELISEFGKEIFETLQSRKLEQSAYNICCAAQFVIRTMDSSEQKEIFSIMKKCGCEGKNGKENTEDFLTEVVRAENNTASSAYDRKRLYEKINKACPPKKAEAGKGIHNQENDYEMEI